ncbi:glycerophosphoryl diester phosphodiesterase membrane domain-containing protein [Calothrix sp. FACHB-156]|nr:glycerophosphoryl diester phosphodiesterase membrane domain-containing protein [Nostoc linckia FACHB-104]MBD2337836.1 glycerophosphoryl diester phosphodiesterase membrane domain-containing protein [Calothrix sp. FACHB-156]
MTGDFGSPSPMQPLSVGNVVSAGIRLYRSHLKDYFLLALKAYVWILVPVYGWAKFYALTGLISRLAFGDLVDQPESISAGERFVNSRLWQFLLTMLLMLIVGMGIVFGISFAFVIVGVLSAVVVGGLGQQSSPVATLLVVLIGLIVGIAALVAVFWLLTRFYLVDVPLSIEDNVDATSTISRSWELTQGHVWRILLISFVAVLITFPIQLVVQILATIIQLLFTPLLQQGNSAASVLVFLLVLALSFASGAVVLPFWQSIKAVIYYDLRSRREGLGLKLRDREI